jgi:tetratricopeptide (TPR) repeat protein
VLGVEELLERFSETTSLIEAERILDSIAAVGYPPDLPLGDLYDSLAEAAAEAGDYGRAIRAQQRALGLGCQWPELGREMLGWYFLKDGRVDEGEALFEVLRLQRRGDALLLLTLAAARRDAGLHADALGAYDEALATAIASDPDMIDQVRIERRHCREELGLELDADDLLAPDRVQRRAEEVAVVLRWFAREQQHARAVGRPRRRRPTRGRRLSRDLCTAPSVAEPHCPSSLDCTEGRRRLAPLRRGFG